MFNITEACKTAYPDGGAGVLVMRNVTNPKTHAALDVRKQDLEQNLRERFAGGDRATIRALEPIQAYNTYYRKFKKTYHVQLQLESVAFKGKSIPSVASLVEAMFMAELKNMLLTAGHDLDVVNGQVTLDVSDGSEQYTTIRGDRQLLKRGDMMISDSDDIMSSIVYGPDQRTRITSDTRNALFTVYAPPGITGDSVRSHLEDIRDNVLLISPDGETELLEFFGAD